jgi:hypothetical protein
MKVAPSKLYAQAHLRVNDVDIVAAEVYAHIISREFLYPAHSCDDIALAQRNVDASSYEGRIDSTVKPLASFHDVSFDKDFLTILGIVVDRSCADDRISICPYTRIPRPSAGDVGNL